MRARRDRGRRCRNVNSEHIGSRTVSGRGGAPDFARGAHDSPGGLTIVALHSRDPRGRTRLVKELDDPSLAADVVDAVATENGPVLLAGPGRAGASARLGDHLLNGGWGLSFRTDWDGSCWYSLKVSDIVASIEAKTADETADAGHGSLVARVAADIRSLVLQRDLLPGEQVRQEDLARKLGTSRSPIREALQVLAAEGIVRYERNRGYFVARFTTDEMQQLYLIRELLESEILSRLPPVSEATLEQLRAINDRIRTGHDGLQAVIELNSRFHDLVFADSDLHILKSELQQIGRMTIAYQSLSINALTGWGLLASDHDRIIDALAAHDNATLVEMCREHRDRSLARLGPILG